MALPPKLKCANQHGEYCMGIQYSWHTDFKGARMLLDLNDASSIVEWWAVYPQRHGPLLADWAQRRPEYRGSILEARRRIKANPVTRGLLERAQSDLPSAAEREVPLTHDEQAAAETAPS